MQCPKCEASLEPRQGRDVEVDACVSCGGVWLDFGELEPFLEEQFPGFGEALDPGPDPAVDWVKVSCPVCTGTGKMLKVRMPDHPDILMDVCKICHGIWLDGGEVSGARGGSAEKVSPLVVLLGLLGF